MSLTVIVPCYNEEECVPELYREVVSVLGSVSGLSFGFIFVDDGSSDGTLPEIKKLAESDYRVKYISLSRNFGKEAAIYAGLSAFSGDVAVTMDCDLQHPPHLLPDMLNAIGDGFDCCGAKRISRKGEPFIRSAFSGVFYRLINAVSGTKIEPGATDYRMMTADVVKAILLLTERERFSKGIFSWVGFKTKWIEYENVERVHGKTKWSIFGLILYALNGIVSFSAAPLKLATALGALIVLGSFSYALYMIISALINGADVPGYVSLLVFVIFLNGVTILLLGIIGEYLAKVFSEAKNRPLYITRETNISEE